MKQTTIKRTRVLHLLRTLVKDVCSHCSINGPITYDPEFDVWRHGNGLTCDSDAIVKMIEKIKAEK